MKTPDQTTVAVVGAETAGGSLIAVTLIVREDVAIRLGCEGEGPLPKSSTETVNTSGPLACWFGR